MQKLIDRGAMVSQGSERLGVQRRKEWFASARYRRSVGVALIAAALLMSVVLEGCGGSGTSGNSQPGSSLAGNWQFTMAPQTDGNAGDPTFSGGLQGGFLLDNNGNVSGQTVYSVTSSTSQTGPCNSGSAPVTVTVSGQNVTITEVAGTQTFTLTGTVSSDGSTMTGSYTSTAGTAPDGSVCGYAESGPSSIWSAALVPPVTGTIAGSFHSTSQNSGLGDQDFVVSGSLNQGKNIGASNATVTGTLSFINTETNLSVYPCFSTASVNGQISGSSLILQIIGTNGATVGQIGASAGSSTGVNPVTLISTQGGSILQGIGPSYMVQTGACPGGGSLASTTVAGDSGNICLALNGGTACQQPVTLSPVPLTFPEQALNVSSTQTATVTFNTAQSAVYLSLALPQNGGFNYLTPSGLETYSDFNGLANFTATDNCVSGGETLLPSQNGATFSAAAGQSCKVTVAFVPQEGCSWLPFPSSGNGQSIAGAAPEYCPFPLTASVLVNGVTSPDDSETSFALPVTGVGLSALQPSTPELDFGSENPSNPAEASLPQTLTFTNTSTNPVQILGSAPCTNNPNGKTPNKLPRPLMLGSGVAGLQVVANYSGPATISADNDTITYGCDNDRDTLLPSFQISSDSCTGTLVNPGASCSLQIAYVPQPTTYTDNGNGLDAFLELNTVQCPGNDCEIDSGRFPVELKANGPSPLRMAPGAGLDFGYQKKGTTSAPLTITLLNDPNLANAQTVTFLGKIAVQGNFAETDDCPVTLAPGSSCTLSVTFTPTGTGFEHGSMTINYSPEPVGNPQIVQLRGSGQ